MTGSTSVAPAPDPAVTAADMVAGHVGLDISCLDRLYLTGFVAKLQTAGGVSYFLRSPGQADRDAHGVLDACGLAQLLAS